MWRSWTSIANQSCRPRRPSRPVPVAPLPFVADVSDEDSIEASMDEIASALGPIDILVNNAAVGRYAPVAELTLADWTRTLGVNLIGPFLCVRSALRHVPAYGGAIVNIASVAAHLGSPGSSAYAASKGGLCSFAPGLAVELAPLGIRVNAVSPGSTDTPLTAQLSDARTNERRMSRVPLARMAQGSELASWSRSSFGRRQLRYRPGDRSRRRLDSAGPLTVTAATRAPLVRLRCDTVRPQSAYTHLLLAPRTAVGSSRLGFPDQPHLRREKRRRGTVEGPRRGRCTFTFSGCTSLAGILCCGSNRDGESHPDERIATIWIVRASQPRNRLRRSERSAMCAELSRSLHRWHALLETVACALRSAIRRTQPTAHRRQRLTREPQRRKRSSACAATAGQLSESAPRSRSFVKRELHRPHHGLSGSAPHRSRYPGAISLAERNRRVRATFVPLPLAGSLLSLPTWPSVRPPWLNPAAWRSLRVPIQITARPPPGGHAGRGAGLD